MRAFAWRTSKLLRWVPKRKMRESRTAPPSPPPPPPPNPHVHFEGCWNDSWHFRRCCHEHETLIEAAQCVKPTGAGWYIIAVEDGHPRELRHEEDEILNRFRFGGSAALPPMAAVLDNAAIFDNLHAHHVDDSWLVSEYKSAMAALEKANGIDPAQPPDKERPIKFTMDWGDEIFTIHWGGEVVSGYDFAEILAEAIEAWLLKN